MKKFYIIILLLFFAFSAFSQSGRIDLKYPTTVPSLRVGGLTKLRLDSITQNVDTIKFWNSGSELITNGSGIWTGTGIRLDTTLAKVTLGIDQVTNESKATMFNLPLFTGTSTFSGSLIPSLSATYYFGSNDNRWNGIYFANSAFMNWANNISISGINDRLEFIGGDLDLNNNNLYSTGDIGTDLSRVNHLYVDSLFSNYSDIILTGYAPLNSPTFTGIVTMPNTNLPSGTSAFLGGNINSYINFSEFQIDINAHVDLGDYDLWANYIGDETDRVEGGYFRFVFADTMLTQSIGVADTAVSYGFFDNLNINNRPTVGIATLATTDDINDSIDVVRSWVAQGGGTVYPEGSGIPIVVSGTSWGTTIPATGAEEYSTENYGATGTGDIVLNIGATMTDPVITNAPRSTGTVVAGTGITATMLSRFMYFNTASAIDITADPQIANGTSGQLITIVGSSDTNTLTLDDSAGLRLTGQMVLGIGDNITLFYEGTIGDWIEISRSNN